jgi:hypothetical protein
MLLAVAFPPPSLFVATDNDYKEIVADARIVVNSNVAIDNELRRERIPPWRAEWMSEDYLQPYPVVCDVLQHVAFAEGSQHVVCEAGEQHMEMVAPSCFNRTSD